MKQHKWHKEIKAWADGAEIEFKVNGEGEWMLLKGTPYWECKNDLFRIKPQPKEKHFKCNGFCGYYECNEIQARDSNLCKRVTDWKPQPKELDMRTALEIAHYALQSVAKEYPVQEAVDACERALNTQPKEPQYLYAYKDYVRDDGSTTSKITISRTQLNTENYIGKIKLEERGE